MEIFKEEPIEFKDLQETGCILIKKESIEETSVGCDNDSKVEDDVNPLQSDSDFSLNDKKRRKINMKNIDTSHGEGLMKAEKKKRVRTKKLTSEVKLKSKTRKLQTEKLTSDKSNLDLSEQFIYFILEKVDELCENISNGDPDIQRSIKVNWDLNNAVNCYRSALDLEEQILIESDTKYDIGVEIDNNCIAKDNMGVEIDNNCDVKYDKIENKQK